jgi:hypothetical protein
MHRPHNGFQAWLYPPNVAARWICDRSARKPASTATVSSLRPLISDVAATVSNQVSKALITAHEKLFLLQHSNGWCHQLIDCDALPQIRKSDRHGLIVPRRDRSEALHPVRKFPQQGYS